MTSLVVTATVSSAGGTTVHRTVALSAPYLGFFSAQGVATAGVQVGGSAAILNSFNGAAKVPTGLLGTAQKVGAMPMVTIEPQTYALTDIAAGKYDAQWTSWATTLGNLNSTVFVRWAHEMNGGWYPWGVNAGSNTAAQYVAAWTHVVTLMRGIASNLQFVWCVAEGGNTTQGMLNSLYPGDALVDWVSMDGYNRGSPWRSFSQVFSALYAQLNGMSSQRVLIAEVGCVEGTAGQKAAWITDAFMTQIPSMPQIQAVCYFDGPGGGNYTYPWESAADSMAAMKAVFTSGTYCT